MVVVGFICLAGMLVIPFINRKKAQYRRNSVLTGHSQVTSLKLVLIGWGIIAIFCIPIIWAARTLGVPDSLKSLTSLGIRKDNFTVDHWGKVVKLDASKVSVTMELVNVLVRLRHLQNLTLGPPGDGVLDLRRMPWSDNKLDYVKASAKSLSGLESSELSTLHLINPINDLARIKSTSVTELYLSGDCATLGDLRKHFPQLMQLSISEDIARRTAAEFLSPYTNLILKIGSMGEPQLEWLRSEHAECILVLSKPIGYSTKNVEHLERFSMSADGLDPELLSKAKSLHWLVLTIHKPQTSQWYRKLQAAIESLPALSSFEIRTEVSGASLRSAKGRKDIGQLLDYLSEHPSSVGTIQQGK